MTRRPSLLFNCNYETSPPLFSPTFLDGGTHTPALPPVRLQLQWVTQWRASFSFSSAIHTNSPQIPSNQPQLWQNSVKLGRNREQIGHWLGISDKSSSRIDRFSQTVVSTLYLKCQIVLTVGNLNACRPKHSRWNWNQQEGHLWCRCGTILCF